MINIPKWGILAFEISEWTKLVLFELDIGFVEGVITGCFWWESHVIELGTEIHDDRGADDAAAEALSCSRLCLDSMWRHFIRLFWNHTFTYKIHKWINCQLICTIVHLIIVLYFVIYWLISTCLIRKMYKSEDLKFSNEWV